ncbi:uncharacterized protein LOC112231239 isoform X2 [Oncorhynchus tshawytscha]|uniref:uncharacterized protein LOC112231239 isoform X2 n=1 Tax=Oncorhynchus tshawytscha TaxID=74940 RepID=UPI000D09E721|nr:uncharacterized protein LOC112231239 isoform X2 [Oncorhynchus tshawytscha]
MSLFHQCYSHFDMDSQDTAHYTHTHTHNTNRYRISSEHRLSAMALTHGSATVLLIFLWTLSMTDSKEAYVTCLFHEDCMLPCSFTPTGAVVIHWYKQQIPVHSYYYNKDQYGLQNKHFNGRTCLFNSQIAHGNASLLLKRIKVQDKGRYKCYTSTRKRNQETFVNLGVKALIQSVRIEMTGEVVSCSSQNIYPAPQVAWNTDPASGPETLQNSTIKTPDSKGLYTVESTVRILGNVSDHAYFCSVISADKAQVWTVSLRQQVELIGEAGQELSIPCIAPQNLQNFSLTWTFTRTNDPTVILSYDSRTRRTSNLWEGRAGLEQDQVLMGNGSLLLHNPENQEHSGTYTCTFTGLQSRHMVQTQVNITVTPIEDEQNSERSWLGTVASVAFFVFTVSVALPRYLRHRGKQTTYNWKDGRPLPIMRPSHADTAIIMIGATLHQQNGAGLDETGTKEHRPHSQGLYISGPHTLDGDITQPYTPRPDELASDVPETAGCCSPRSQSHLSEELDGDTIEPQTPGNDEPQPHIPESDEPGNGGPVSYSQDLDATISYAQDEMPGPCTSGDEEEVVLHHLQTHEEVLSDQTPEELVPLDQMTLKEVHISRTYQVVTHQDLT